MDEFLADKLLNASPPVLVVLAINALLIPLKHVPKFPIWLLPFVAMAAGILIYPLVAGWSSRNIVLGFLFGAASVGLHQQLKQFFYRKEEYTRQRTGNTEFIKKNGGVKFP